MRPIDADELKIDYGFTYSDITPTHEEMYALIDRQKTVESARKTGKWIDETFKPWGLAHHPYKCDQCGEHSETDSNFCPNCGAKMEGE